MLAGLFKSAPSLRCYVPTMPAKKVPAPLLITDPGELRPLCQRLGEESRIAFDTEAASFHRYVDRVYLVQVSSDRETALVDPLEVANLAPLGKLLSDQQIQIVFHDADYDLRILDRDYRFHARNIFDTRVAAQLAGEPSVGLGALLEKFFHVRVDKKYQRADWSRRPLTPGMIAYAADDTRYLPALRDTLEQRLVSLGRLEWAREEFQRLEQIRWTQAGPDVEDAYLRVKGAKALGRRQLAVLRELYAWRDATASKLDRARFRVVSNSALLAVAKASPHGPRQLAKVDGLSENLARRYSKELVAAVERGRAVPESELPRVRRSKRPEPDPGYDQRLERLKQLRNERAEAIGLDPGLVCPNGSLQAVARAEPESKAALGRVEELRRWQREAIGDQAILAAVKGE
jgi:ribonuclease D